jgi:hypothetical protein
MDDFPDIFGHLQEMDQADRTRLAAEGCFPVFLNSDCLIMSVYSIAAKSFPLTSEGFREACEWALETLHRIDCWKSRRKQVA